MPGLLFVPARPTRPGSVTLWLDPQGKAAGAEPGGPIEKRVLAGETVFAIDVRGWGESAAAKRARITGYDSAYQTFMRAYLLGRSIIGMQAVDVLAAASYLPGRSFTSIQVIFIGQGSVGGALAIYAGILDPRIQKVTAADSVPTYLELARMPEHQGPTNIFVHRVLADFDIPDLIAALGERYELE